MTFSGVSRIVRHWNFGDREAFHLDQRWKKTMRTVEEFDVGNAFALEHTISAARVGDVLTGQFIADPIGNSRRSNSKPSVSFTARFNPRAAHAIGAAQRFHHCRQIVWVVL